MYENFTYQWTRGRRPCGFDQRIEGCEYRRLRKYWKIMHRLTYTRRTGTLLKTWVKVVAR